MAFSVLEFWGTEVDLRGKHPPVFIGLSLGYTWDTVGPTASTTLLSDVVGIVKPNVACVKS